MKGFYYRSIDKHKTTLLSGMGKHKSELHWWRHQKQQPVRYQCIINAGWSAHEEVLSAWQRRSGLCP